MLTPTVAVLLCRGAWCVAGRNLQDNLITSVPSDALKGLGGNLEFLCVAQPTHAVPRANRSVVQRGGPLCPPLRLHAYCIRLAAVWLCQLLAS